MATLVVRRVGGKANRVLTFGGEGQWVVADGDTELATARSRTTTNRLDIEAGGRRLTADMPGMYRSGPEKAFTVTDVATGERVVDGTRISGGSLKAPFREKWAVTFATGAELEWIYKNDPRQLGFYDSAGDPVMVVGHQPELLQDRADVGLVAGRSAPGLGIAAKRSTAPACTASYVHERDVRVTCDGEVSRRVSSRACPSLRVSRWRRLHR
jgi:hypothetical protein